MGGPHWLLASMWNRVINIGDDEVKNSPSDPVQIIAPPGSNQIIIPLAGFFEIDMASGAYTGVDRTSSWHLEVGSLKTNPVLLSGILDSGESYGWAWTLLRQEVLGSVPPFFFGQSDAGSSRKLLGAGRGLFLKASNGSNFGGGGINNKTNVTVSYILLNLD